MRASFRKRVLGTILAAIGVVGGVDAGVELVASDAQAGDAFGRSLAAAGDVALVGAPGVDDGGDGAGAVYAFERVGTSWVERAKLDASDAAAGQAFGTSLALDGDTAVVGAPGDAGGRGAAYVLVRSGTSWIEAAKLVAADGAAGDALGTSVAISGDTIALGAPQASLVSPDAGAVYVFVRGGTSWSQEARLDGAGAGDELGASVALDGERLAAGAPMDELAGPLGSGSVAVFERSGTLWSPSATLLPGSPVTNGAFGSAVATVGGRIVAGAPAWPNSGSFRGAAYVFRSDGTGWVQDARLGGSGISALGGTLALAGGRLAVGAPGLTGHAFLHVGTGSRWTIVARVPVEALIGDELGGALAFATGSLLVGSPGRSGTGKVFAFELDALGELALPTLADVELLAAGGEPDDELGFALARSGDTLLVGAPGDRAPNGAQDSGAVYVWVREPGGWVQQARLAAPDGVGFDRFGEAVAIDGDLAVIGAPEDHTLLGTRAGSAYVFTRASGVWTFRRKLQASDGSAQNEFGTSVAVDDAGRILVGSPYVDELPKQRVGAAYAFEGSGGDWNEVARLSLATTAQGDLFGGSVALDGPLALIGARGVDVAGPDVGAAYVYATADWTQEAVLLPADAAEVAFFGHAVALSGETAVVGAPSTFVQGERAAGAAFVFGREGTTWSERLRLEGESPGDTEQFGCAVSLAADQILVGQFVDDGENDLRVGSATAFLRDGATWTRGGRLVGRDGSDRCGYAVAAGDGWAAAGAPDSFDDKGAVYVFDTLDGFVPFCDASDASLESCPCANPGAPDAGCDVAQGTGGVRLDVLARRTEPTNRATLRGTGFPAMGAPTVLAIRASDLDPAMPVVFGNGLRCLGLPIVRLTATTAAGGASEQTVGHGALAGPGEHYYQLWFRDTPVMFCSPEAFNLSSGRTIVW